MTTSQMSSGVDLSEQQQNAYYTLQTKNNILPPENEKVQAQLLKKFKKRILSNNYNS